jgi:hypothetical protein
MRFELDADEITAFKKWEIRHEKVCPITEQGAIGGKQSFTFIPNSIGEVHKVTCACGAEENLTDYDLW